MKPFTLGLPVASAYWVISPNALTDHPKVAVFRNWLFAEASLGQARTMPGAKGGGVSAVLPGRADPTDNVAA